MSKTSERKFEDAIEAHLLAHGGYEKGSAAAYDIEKALFIGDVIAFIQQTQDKNWQHLSNLYGEKAEATLIEALCKELDFKGALTVLRQGFKCAGRVFRLVYFEPASTLNADAWDDYNKNRLTVTRQVHFDPEKAGQSIDIVLAVNGLPVVTMELKNEMTGQNSEDAQSQYKQTRSPNAPLFRFSTRALVHFAVDTELVSMTTKLEGEKTVFLPFNRGNNHGAGNPPCLDGNYRSAYLWEEILTKDSLMDILARFLHLQKPARATGAARKDRIMIFPRYHQIDVVRRLIADATKNGAGKNYLIQHSAGSGKSNSIAWLAHRLSSLHDAHNKKIFDSVIVITDRRILDQQLQDTIYQFDHKQGVIEKIDENTQQLAKALASGVPIIISTIQKFPYIEQAISTMHTKGEHVDIDTKDKNFAVIVDEAHSSQSGEAAMELKKTLNKDGISAIIAEQMDEDTEDLSNEVRQNILREALKRPQQKNLSFFAFTATPKFKTLAVFGEASANSDTRQPFHLYSMRQAIEEKFILDVLANYTTWASYFELIQKAEDTDVPTHKARRALLRFVEMHPHNLEQKIEVIVNNFENSTKNKIGGYAKAMIVTSSRLHAVRYKEAFDKYIADRNISGLKALVAFSGSVIDDKIPEKSFTETGMNNIKESELAAQFATTEYQVLIVAEKYQTGFDQPLLHTMYIDKKLKGVHAVQTLSRLNRTMTGKYSTFVLDFTNTHEEIYEAFKPYYETTRMEEMPDAHRLEQLKHDIDERHIFTANDVTELAEIWFKKPSRSPAKEHGAINAILDKACDKYKALSDTEQEDFKKLLVNFRSLYTFLSQVIFYQDTELEKYHAFIRLLLSRLPRRAEGEGYQFENEADLLYYRLEKTSEASINLNEGDAEPVKGPIDVGTGATKDEEDMKLSMLIDKINERFGTDLKHGDEYLLQQIVEEALGDEKSHRIGKANNLANFTLFFHTILGGLLTTCMNGNQEIVTRILDDDELKKGIGDILAEEAYNKIRTSPQAEV